MDDNQELASVFICQEGVKQTGGGMIRSSIMPQILLDIRRAYGDSLSQFGWRLKRMINPKATYPYTRQYISRLEHGLDNIPIEIEAAYWNLAATLDDVPIGLGGAVNVRILAQPNQVPDDSFLPRSAKVIECGNPSCRVRFIRTHPRQKYHDPGCR